MAVTHTKVSVIADGADTSLIQPQADWNADHTVHSVLPDADSTYDLGSAAYRWRDAYVEGVKFPATQVASADANTQDDYRKGSWTPTGNGVTFSAAGGNYTKIGRAVIIDGYATWPATASTWDALLLGLPFTPISEAAVAIGYSNVGSDVLGHVVYNETRIAVENTSGAKLTNVGMSEKTIYFSGVYHTT